MRPDERTDHRPQRMTAQTSHWRESKREQDRIAALMSLVPAKGRRALDIGARDGYLSQRLTERYAHVTAVDLVRPTIDHPDIESVEANIAQMPFRDNDFDLVLCAEVLEHLPADVLARGVREIVRVAKRWIIVGVPYNQDLRLGRTTCNHCGTRNPPWGHVNKFNEGVLRRLFPDTRSIQFSYVGRTRDATNRLAAALMNYAGNPFGTYMQDEACITCGLHVGQPHPRSLPQRMATRAAHIMNRIQQSLSVPKPCWIHALIEK
jgi:SAM-dependent methyltransferase